MRDFGSKLYSQEQKARGREKKLCFFNAILPSTLAGCLQTFLFFAVEDLRWKNWSTDRIEFLENVAFLRRHISGCRVFQEMYLSAVA